MVIEELDPQPPEEVAKAAGQKRKADLAAMEPKSVKRPAAQVQNGLCAEHVAALLVVRWSKIYQPSNLCIAGTSRAVAFVTRALALQYSEGRSMFGRTCGCEV